MVIGRRRGVGDEWDASMLLHLVDDDPDQYWAEVGCVVPLAHVALDSDRVPGLEAFCEACVVE